MRWLLLTFYLSFFTVAIKAQSTFGQHLDSLQKIKIDTGVNLTIDEPKIFTLAVPTKIIIFALPNGNTTAQTFGKALADGDDWHFDIQHIGAQTALIRNTDRLTNYIVVYAANDLKSWPAWRKKYSNSDAQIGKIVADLLVRYQKWNPQIILTAHSGGGSFIFGYFNSQPRIPSYIERIGFLDATYGYETEKHQNKLKDWLKEKHKFLQVIAYNDSVVLYNGKPLVSPTGGTWYRSKLMAKDLQSTIRLKHNDALDRLSWFSSTQNVSFKLIKNPQGLIYHTVLVEKNGFIDLIFRGTKYEDQNYTFWGNRAYTPYILH